MNPRNLQKITISADMSAEIQETMRARMLCLKYCYMLL